MSIEYICHEYIRNSELLHKIYNLKNNYWWSNDFSPQFYIDLASAGFITVTHVHEGELLLIPEIQTEYAILDFKDMHISKKVQKLINKNEYNLTIDERFDDVIESIQGTYEDCWIRGKYVELLRTIKNSSYEDFKLISVELTKKSDNSLVAGEIGYITNNIYTSLSGFLKREKEYDSCGTLQLILLAKYLDGSKISFWNLGHAKMEYKKRIGAKIYDRFSFLERFLKINR